MPRVAIRNLSRPLENNLVVGMCAAFGCRLRGLTFRRALAEDDGLLMDCGRASRYDSAIHMMGVFFDLGIIWLDERQMVVDCGLARRWVSVLAPTAPARYILEVCPGRLREFQPGDTIEFHEA